MNKLLKVAIVTISLFFGSFTGATLAQHGIEEKINAQVIIKFSEPANELEHNRFIEAVAQDIGVTLIYIRPMSGGGHVFRIKDKTWQDKINSIIKLLSQRSDVEYAEEDKVMLHQTDLKKEI